MSDIWSEDQDVSPKSTTALMAKRYREIEYEQKKLKAERDSIENELLGLFPQEFGEQSKVFDGVRITVETAERFDWDTEILENIFASSDALPDYVKKRLLVDKRAFAKLNEETRRVLLPALTRKLGTTKLTVTDV
jgi:hypothetical protein